MNTFASVPGGGNFNSSFQNPGIFASTPGGPPPAEYAPKQYPEVVAYEQLWAAANPSGGDQLMGAQAVPFFQKSGVDNGILKQIWSLSTPSSTMNKGQFYTALRYITMVQNGEIPVSKVPPPPAAYAVSSEEMAKYRALFAGYDADKDGLVTGAEARSLFDKSGLDPNTLATIWQMSDVDRDGSLNVREFTVAFHLIICKSKKNLPLPPALPAPLVSILQAPAAAPPTAPTPPAPQQPAPVKVPVSEAFGDIGPVVTTAAPVAGGASSTTSHTSGASGGASSYSGASQSHNHNHSDSGGSTGVSFSRELDDQKSDLQNSVSALADTAKKVSNVSNASAELSAKTAGTLKNLVQQLTTERISLNATVTSAEQGLRESQDRLQVSITELNALRSELDELRKRNVSAIQSHAQIQNQLGQLHFEKQALLREIEVVRQQAGVDTRETADISAQAAGADASAHLLSQKNAALTSERNTLATEVATLRAELSTLQNILSALQKDRVMATEEKARMRSLMTTAQTRARGEAAGVTDREAEIARLKDEKTKVLAEKTLVVEKLAGSLHATVHTAEPVAQVSYTPLPTPVPPAHTPAPVAASVAAPVTSMPVPVTAAPSQLVPPTPPTSTIHSSGKSGHSFGDDAFGDIDDGFTAGHTAPPAPVSQKPVKEAAFGDFPDVDDTFGAVDTFSSGATTKAAATTPVSTSSAGGTDDAFGDFGDPDDAFGPVSVSVPPAVKPVENGFSTTAASKADDAFGDFGDADDAFGPVSATVPQPTARSSLATVAASSSPRADTGFGAFGDDGFDLPPKPPAAPSAPPAVPSTKPPADDGFGDFGKLDATPAPAAASTAFADFGAFDASPADFDFKAPSTPAATTASKSGFDDFGAPPPSSTFSW